MKSFKNIGVLDLRKTTEEEMREIQSIKNIGTVVVREAQLGQMGHIKQVNIGAILSLPENVLFVVQNGSFTLTRAMLESMQQPTLYVINGKFKLEPIQDATLLDKIYQLMVNGKCIVLETDMGILSGRIQINGKSLIYRADERVVDGTYTLEDNALYGLSANTNLLVDRMVALQAFDGALFNESIARIRINDAFIVRKDFLKILAPKVENYIEVAKTVVEEGYAYYDKLTIDSTNYQTLTSDKLHVGGKLVIDVTVEQLQSVVSRIICKTLEIQETAVEGIKPLIERADKIKVIDPDLIENYSALKIDAAYLESQENIKLANYGALSFDDSVTEEMVSLKIDKIENYGVLSCGKEVHGAILKKIKANFGLVQAKGASELSESVQVVHDDEYNDDCDEHDEDCDDDHDDDYDEDHVDLVGNLGSYSY